MLIWRYDIEKSSIFAQKMSAVFSASLIKTSALLLMTPPIKGDRFIKQTVQEDIPPWDPMPGGMEAMGVPGYPIEPRPVPTRRCLRQRLEIMDETQAV
jgi:hypothetical protein